MSQEELLQAQIRMSAMQAAIAFYCCYRGQGPGNGDPFEGLQEVLELLMQIRDMLLDTALVPGPTI